MQRSKQISILASVLSLTAFLTVTIALSALAGGKQEKEKHCFTPRKADAASKRGQVLYRANECRACHSIGGTGCAEGVALDGIGARRSESFLLSQLTDPEKHVSSHPEIYDGDPNMMPHPHLTAQEVKQIVSYLLTLPPAKAEQTQPHASKAETGAPSVKENQSK